MVNLNYSYSNNGVFPFRILKRSRHNHIENIHVDHDTGEEITSYKNSFKNSLANLNQGFKTSGVSQSTRRKISKHCQVLGLASEDRTIRNSKGQYVKFRTSFITLTLPSEQVHEDAEITKKVFGVFLDKCRKLGILQNYVWRAEKQNNGNIHYHILTDSYTTFSMFRRVWFLALRNLGYLQEYQRKFSKMSYSQYHAQPFNKGKTPAQTASSYATGTRSNWSTPPACHVEFISDISAVIQYVAKYISKNTDQEKNIVTGRSWGASKSVSQSVRAFCTDVQFSTDWYNAGALIMRRKLFSTDYFSMVFFKITSLVAWFPEVLSSMRRLLSLYFVPCDYWRNSVGLYT